MCIFQVSKEVYVQFNRISISSWYLNGSSDPALSSVNAEDNTYYDNISVIFNAIKIKYECTSISVSGDLL